MNTSLNRYFNFERNSDFMLLHAQCLFTCHCNECIGIRVFLDSWMRHKGIQHSKESKRLTYVSMKTVFLHVVDINIGSIDMPLYLYNNP